MSLRDGQLPKGMVQPPIEDMPQEPGGFTHEDVNYTRLIREALASIPGIKIDVLSLEALEMKDSPAVVRLEMTVAEEGEA